MEYLSVSDFAEAAGVTPQAIYKRIKSDLAPYAKTENGVKLISKDALNLFTSKQQLSQTAFLQSEVERLTAELESKQQIITSLNVQISAQNEKLLEILDRQATQFQMLLAHQQTSFQQLSNLLNPPKEEQPTDNELTTDTQPVKKPSLFKRIFTKSH